MNIVSQPQQDNTQPESSIKSPALGNSGMKDLQKYGQEDLDQSATRMMDFSKNGEDEEDSSVTQSNEVPAMHHGSFKSKMMRQSPNKRSRNNSKHHHVNQSQANINLSVINNSVEGDQHFSSNINKYQRDSQKRYHPYGIKDQNSNTVVGSNQRGDKSS